MYTVVLLIEQELSEPDASKVVALHADMPDPVGYFVVVPATDLASMNATMSALGGNHAELHGGAAVGLAGDDPEALAADQNSIDAECSAELQRSLERLRSQGVTADGLISHHRPVDALISAVQQVDGQEVVILTDRHLVAEFFHVDWTHQARRHLNVPVLHLVERDEHGRERGLEEGG